MSSASSTRPPSRDQLVNQQITTKSAEANLRERQADPRGRRDRRQGVRRGHLRAGPARPSRARSSWPSPTCRAPRTALDWAQADVREGLCLDGHQGLRGADPQEGRVHPRAGAEQEEGARQYTRDKTIKELESEVEKAHSDELAKKATWELEKSKEDKLEKQIAALHAHGPDRRPGRLRQRPAADSAATSRRSRKGRRSASGRRSSACPTSAGCRSTPRSTSRRSTSIAPQLKAKIRVDAFAERAARRHGHRKSPPCPTRATSSARTSRSTRPGQDRRPARRASGRA